MLIDGAGEATRLTYLAATQHDKHVGPKRAVVVVGLCGCHDLPNAVLLAFRTFLSKTPWSLP